MSGTNVYCGFDLQLPWAVDVIKVPDMIGGWASWPCLEKKTVAQGWKTTIGFSFVLLARKSPMVCARWCVGVCPFTRGVAPGFDMAGLQPFYDITIPCFFCRIQKASSRFKVPYRQYFYRSGTCPGAGIIFVKKSNPSTPAAPAGAVYSAPPGR